MGDQKDDNQINDDLINKKQNVFMNLMKKGTTTTNTIDASSTDIIMKDKQIKPGKYDGIPFIII